MNPHCPDCAIENECKSCYTYKSELDKVSRERDRLLEILLEKVNPIKTSGPEQTEFKPLGPIRLHHSDARRILEARDRAEAQLAAQKERELREIQALEKEVGIPSSPEGNNSEETEKTNVSSS